MSDQEVVLISDQNANIANAALRLSSSLAAQPEEAKEERGYSSTIRPGLPASRNPVSGGEDVLARWQMSLRFDGVESDGR